MGESMVEVPLPAITPQDIQEATQASSELSALTVEQIQHINSQLLVVGAEHHQLPQQQLDHHAEQQQQTFIQHQPPSHYQLQGTWQSPGGRCVNYIVLKENLENRIDITKVYFNIEDISKCPGFNLDLSGVTERYHLNLLNMILEFPHTELVTDLFREFIGSLNPLASTEVSEPIATPRIIEGKGPKIQLKLESFALDGGGEEEEEDVDEDSDRETGPVWQAETEPQVKLEEEKVEVAVERRLSPTLDERRFLDTCRTLGEKPNKKHHYGVVGMNTANCRAICLHCKLCFRGEGNEKEDDQEDPYKTCTSQVIDHILVHHFQTFAYKCDICALTFNNKEGYAAHLSEQHGEPVRTWQCQACSQGFLTGREMKAHMRMAHPEPLLEDALAVSLKCQTCGKLFSSKKTMFAHLRSIHGLSNKLVKREKPLSSVCSICGEKKKSEHNLAQHVKKFHENAFPEPITCQYCTEIKQLRNRKYHTPYSYELHMRQIHSDGAEGKVVCEYCSKEFLGSLGKVKFALKEHIQAVHMGIRKACDECGKTFISNIVLNKHKKHVHRKEGSYPCKACGKVFRYSQQAIDHEYKDRGLMPYACKFCEFKSADNWALAKHKKVCPGNPASVPALNLSL